MTNKVGNPVTMAAHDSKPRPKPGKHQEVPKYDEKLGDDDDRKEREDQKEDRADKNEQKGS